MLSIPVRPVNRLGYREGQALRRRLAENATVPRWLISATPTDDLPRLVEQYENLAPHLVDESELLAETPDEAESTRYYALRMCGVEDIDVRPTGLGGDYGGFVA